MWGVSIFLRSRGGFTEGRHRGLVIARCTAPVRTHVQCGSSAHVPCGSIGGPSTSGSEQALALPPAAVAGPGKGATDADGEGQGQTRPQQTWLENRRYASFGLAANSTD